MFHFYLFYFNYYFDGPKAHTFLSPKKAQFSAQIKPPIPGQIWPNDLRPNRPISSHFHIGPPAFPPIAMPNHWPFFPFSLVSPHKVCLFLFFSARPRAWWVAWFPSPCKGQTTPLAPSSLLHGHLLREALLHANVHTPACSRPTPGTCLIQMLQLQHATKAQHVTFLPCSKRDSTSVPSLYQQQTTPPPTAAIPTCHHHQPMLLQFVGFPCPCESSLPLAIKSLEEVEMGVGNLEGNLAS